MAYAGAHVFDFDDAGNTNFDVTDDIDCTTFGPDQRPRRQRTLTEKGRMERQRLLRNRTVAALAAVTKCKNELNGLLPECDINLHLVKDCFSKYHDLCFSYEQSVENYVKELDSIEEQQYISDDAQMKLKSMRDFRQQVLRTISQSECNVSDQIQDDSVSNKVSEHTLKSKSSADHSHISSRKSAHVFQKAKLAELIAERSMLTTTLKAKELQLEVEIAKARAREIALAESPSHSEVQDRSNKERTHHQT